MTPEQRLLGILALVTAAFIIGMFVGIWAYTS